MDQTVPRAKREFWITFLLAGCLAFILAIIGAQLMVETYESFDRLNSAYFWAVSASFFIFGRFRKAPPAPGTPADPYDPRWLLLPLPVLMMFPTGLAFLFLYIAIGAFGSALFDVLAGRLLLYRSLVVLAGCLMFGLLYLVLAIAGGPVTLRGVADAPFVSLLAAFSQAFALYAMAVEAGLDWARELGRPVDRFMRKELTRTVATLSFVFAVFTQLMVFGGTHLRERLNSECDAGDRLMAEKRFAEAERVYAGVADRWSSGLRPAASAGLAALEDRRPDDAKRWLERARAILKSEEGLQEMVLLPVRPDFFHDPSELRYLRRFEATPPK